MDEADRAIALSEALRAASEYEQLEGAFNSVRQGMFEIIAKSGLGQGELREQMYLGVSVLDKVRSAIFAVAAEADVARHRDLIARILTGQDHG